MESRLLERSMKQQRSAEAVNKGLSSCRWTSMNGEEPTRVVGSTEFIREDHGLSAMVGEV